MTLFYLIFATLLFNTSSDINEYATEFGVAYLKSDSCSYDLINNEGDIFGELTISNNKSHLFLTYNLLDNNISITGVEMENITTNEISTQSNISDVQQYIQKIALPSANNLQYLEVTATATVIRTDHSNAERRVLKSSPSDSIEFDNNIVYELNRCFNSTAKSYQVRRGSRW